MASELPSNFDRAVSYPTKWRNKNAGANEPSKKINTPLGVIMTTFIHRERVQREVEYLFSREEAGRYPHLGRLLHQGYNFVVLKRSCSLQKPHQRSYALACEIICSNGTELLQRRELLTPDFGDLQTLEHFTQHNMLNIMHKHFFGRELVEVK